MDLAIVCNTQSVENSSDDFESYNESHPRYWTNHGYVYSLGDGIIVVYGLYNVTAGEWFYLVDQI